MNIFLAVLLWVLGFVKVQAEEPVHFSTTVNHLSDEEIEVVFSATIDKGWHVYSSQMDAGGPTVASFHLDEARGVEPVGDLLAEGEEHDEMDALFGMRVKYFEQSVAFRQRLHITEQPYAATGYLEYGACNDETCLPPTAVEFSVGEALPAADASGGAPEAAAFSSPTDGGRSLLQVFLLGLLGGLLALLTPCVWPIIPMTVSFFLHRSENRRRAVREAVTYGLSIVVIYVALGVLVTLLFGASALNAMSTNAVFNLLFFALLVLFGASFLGGFEITLPASWNNRVNQKADATTGLLSIFLMAFTLALVSFSCTGPIIGFLLVEVSTMGSLLSPTVGMLGFAVGLALPFSVFALFPAWMKRLPKSGGWLNVVKVSLGFVELAFALKFLSVADMAYGWHLLDREAFLALWIVLAVLLGLYLLGHLRFPGDDAVQHTSVPRFFLALAPLAFAVYMLPGLWGAPLKAISAFAPPLGTQDFNLYTQYVEAKYTDYDEAVAAATASGKPVLIDFTGKGCVNCRKMENSVWTHPAVRAKLQQDFILVSLFVDDKTPLAARQTVEENGKQRTLRTVGDRWSYFQRHRFGANTQPFYVVVDSEGQLLSGPYTYDESVDHFLHFLDEGLQKTKTL